MSAFSAPSALLAATGGGLLARHLRNRFFPPAPPAEDCTFPPYDDAAWLAPPLMIADAPAAVVVPTLRLPASSINVAAWTGGALLAQAIVLLVRWLYARGDTKLRARHVDGRIEITAARRGDRVGGTLVKATPRLRCVDRAIDALQQRHSVAIVVVNR